MAKASVRKYPLALVPKQVLKLEPDATILPGVHHRNTEHVLYVLGNHKPLNTKVHIRMFLTAQVFNYNAEAMIYLGSIHHDIDCYHFFRVTEIE